MILFVYEVRHIILICMYIETDNASNPLTVDTLAPTNLGHSIFQALPTTRLFSEFLVWKKKLKLVGTKLSLITLTTFFLVIEPLIDSLRKRIMARAQ